MSFCKSLWNHPYHRSVVMLLALALTIHVFVSLFWMKMAWDNVPELLRQVKGIRDATDLAKESDKSDLVAKFLLAGHTFLGDASYMAYWPEAWNGAGDKQMKKAMWFSIFTWVSTIIALVYAWRAALGNIQKSCKLTLSVALDILVIWIYPLVMWGAAMDNVGHYFKQWDCYVAIAFLVAYAVCGIFFYVFAPVSASSDHNGAPQIVVVKEYQHVAYPTGRRLVKEAEAYEGPATPPSVATDAAVGGESVPGPRTPPVGSAEPRNSPPSLPQEDKVDHYREVSRLGV